MKPSSPPVAARKNLRQAALDAAMALAESEGPMPLTLDAVAARAGISKGGLLHHFASKDALLTAMVGEVIKGFDDNIRSAAARGRDDHAALTGAHVKRSFAGSGRRSRSGMALLAVAALQPELLAPVRRYMQQRTAAVAASAPRPAEALAAMLIADAIYLFDALGSPALPPALRGDVREVALRLLEPPLREPQTADTRASAAPVRGQAARHAL